MKNFKRAIFTQILKINTISDNIVQNKKMWIPMDIGAIFSFLALIFPLHGALSVVFALWLLFYGFTVSKIYSQYVKLEQWD